MDFLNSIIKLHEVITRLQNKEIGEEEFTVIFIRSLDEILLEGLDFKAKGQVLLTPAEMVTVKGMIQGIMNYTEDRMESIRQDLYKITTVGRFISALAPDKTDSYLYVIS